MSLSYYDWTFISLALFCLIGAFDGLYYHLHKYRLHLYQETKFEHQIHGARGIIFAPIAVLFFVFDVSGLPLYLGLLFLMIDTYLEVIDIKIEDKARAKLGGVSKAEAMCHIFATVFRIAALVLILKEKTWADFSVFNSSLELVAHRPLAVLGILFSFTSLVGGALHFRAKHDQVIETSEELQTAA
jgi:hypothetical protein